jgi:serine/threonine protein kinase
MSIQSRYRKLTGYNRSNWDHHTYKCQCIKTGVFAVLKSICIYDDEGIPATRLREISILKELTHPNIIHLMEAEIVDDRRLYLVFEYFDEATLNRYMNSSFPDGVSMPFIKSSMCQLLKGMVACHSHGIMHRDLKPQNLLVNSKGELKIAGFCLSRTLHVPIRSYTHEVVTLWYRAPEILLGQQQYGFPVDMWSIGTMFAEMVMGCPLWPGDSEISQLYKIFRTLGTPDESSWPGISILPDYKPTFPKWPKSLLLKRSVPKLDALGFELLQQLLCYEPLTRATAKDALKHPWFADMKCEK